MQGDLRIEIAKSDWKFYRNKIASDKFWEIEERIKNDRRHLGVIIEESKPKAVFDIVRFIGLDVITYDDLADFSDDLQQTVKELHNGYR